MKASTVTTRFFYGYAIVVVAFMLQAVGWGVFNSMGVFFKPFMDEFGWSRALISSAFSLAMLVCGMSSILQGRLSDRLGPRVVMAVGGVFLGIGYLLMSQVSHFWHACYADSSQLAYCPLWMANDLFESGRFFPVNICLFGAVSRT